MTDAEKIAALRQFMEARAAQFSAEVFPVRAQDMKFSGRDILAILNGDKPEEEA